MRWGRRTVIALIVPVLVIGGLLVTFRGYANALQSELGTDVALIVDGSIAPASSNSNDGIVSGVAVMGTKGNPDENSVTTKSNAWDIINVDSRELINNVWGAPLNEVVTSGVYVSGDKSFGWFWNRDNPKPNLGETATRPLYPSLRIGGSPWELSKSTSFPIRLADINTLQFDLSYCYPVSPKGSFNLAYDIFLTDTNQPSSDPKPIAEVMIWAQHTFPEPARYYKGDYTDGHNTYELYSWVMAGGRLYYAFVIKGEPGNEASHFVDAKKLIDKLDLNSALYIHGVELGSEVMSGSGRIQITKLRITLNGSEL